MTEIVFIKTEDLIAVKEFLHKKSYNENPSTIFLDEKPTIAIVDTEKECYWFSDQKCLEQASNLFISQKRSFSQITKEELLNRI